MKTIFIFLIIYTYTSIYFLPNSYLELLGTILYFYNHISNDKYYLYF